MANDNKKQTSKTTAECTTIDDVIDIAADWGFPKIVPARIVKAVVTYMAKARILRSVDGRWHVRGQSDRPLTKDEKSAHVVTSSLADDLKSNDYNPFSGFLAYLFREPLSAGPGIGIEELPTTSVESRVRAAADSLVDHAAQRQKILLSCDPDLRTETEQIANYIMECVEQKYSQACEPLSVDQRSDLLRQVRAHVQRESALVVSGPTLTGISGTLGVSPFTAVKESRNSVDKSSPTTPATNEEITREVAAIKQRAVEQRAAHEADSRAAEEAARRMRRINDTLWGLAHFTAMTNDIAEFARLWTPHWMTAAKVLIEDVGLSTLDNLEVTAGTTPSVARKILERAMAGVEHEQIEVQLVAVCVDLGFPGAERHDNSVWGLRNFLDRVYKFATESSLAAEPTAPAASAVGASTVSALPATDHPPVGESLVTTEQPWKKERTNDLPLRGKTKILDAIDATDDSRHVWRTLLAWNKNHDGPIKFDGSVPIANRGELCAWIRSITDIVAAKKMLDAETGQQRPDRDPRARQRDPLEKRVGGVSNDLDMYEDGLHREKKPGIRNRGA